ncbi:MAG: carbon-nitrogen hydrolase [Candidatus Bathyarchaeota archaeon]|nr:carbon-nitrogen hydrolase [Candidatus Bathyarchaeota archaeon]
MKPEKLLPHSPIENSRKESPITAKDTPQENPEVPKKVTLALIQTAPSENLQENQNKTLRRIEEAARKGAQIVGLQELYHTPYFPQQKHQEVHELAETIPGQSTAALAVLAKKHGVVIVAPLFEKGSDGKFYNSAATIDADGEILGVYRKIHVPHDQYFYEKNYFSDGNLGYGVYRTRYACIGVLICYDQWFPEPARISVLKGADILFYPTAIGTIQGCSSDEGDWHDAWKTVQRAHAIENGVHVAAVNRVGIEGQLKFWGGSFVCDSFGQVLGEANGEKEETLLVTLDLSKNRQIREGWGFLANRRPDTYLPLTKDSP